MPINNTEETLSWRNGQQYPPGAEIPEDLAKAAGILTQAAEEAQKPLELREGEVVATESGAGDAIVVPTDVDTAKQLEAAKLQQAQSPIQPDPSIAQETLRKRR